MKKQDSPTAQQRFDHYRSNPAAALDAETIAALADKHVVLIAGLGAQAIKRMEEIFGVTDEKRYFGYFKKILEGQGITVSLHYPETETVEASARKLIHRAGDLHKQGGGKPLVLLGHSRGGLVAVKAAMEAPALLRDGIVSKIMTLQSPVNGNSLTDLSMFAMARAGFGWLRPEGNFGLKSLEENRIQQSVGPAAFDRLAAADRKLVSDAVIWVAGSTFAQQAWPERNNAQKLSAIAGPNDAYVAVRDQRRLEYGRVGGYFNDISHREAVTSDGTASENRRSRALVYALMEILANDLAGVSATTQEFSRLEAGKISAALEEWRVKKSGAGPKR